MKKVFIVLIALITSASLFAQSKSETSKMKKVETIKIIDGDTVMHDVRMVDGDQHRSHYKMMKHMHEMEDVNFEEMETMLNDIDVFIHMDDKHKKMMVQRLNHHDIDLDSIIKSINVEEDLIIDIDKKKHQIKVIKINMDEMDGEEVTVIEIKKGKGKKGMKYEEGKKGYGQNLKVYPNPSKDEFNLEINTLDENTKVTVVDQNGKSLFEKTYKEIGQYSEQIKLKDVKKGFVVVTLSGETLKIQKKLIVE